MPCGLPAAAAGASHGFFHRNFPGENPRRRTARPRRHPPQLPPVCRCGHTPPPVPLTASAAGLLPVPRSAGLPVRRSAAGPADGIRRRSPSARPQLEIFRPRRRGEGFYAHGLVILPGLYYAPYSPPSGPVSGLEIPGTKKAPARLTPCRGFPVLRLFCFAISCPPIVPPNRQTARKTARKFVQKKFPGPP